jgi:hypothetical protein
MSEAEQDSARALLPGLHYLAAEALRSGCPDVSQIIFQAITRIETMVDREEDDNEQCGALAGCSAGSQLAH